MAGAWSFASQAPSDLRVMDSEAEPWPVAAALEVARVSRIDEREAMAAVLLLDNPLRVAVAGLQAAGGLPGGAGPAERGGAG
jgi:hypothetical protein